MGKPFWAGLLLLGLLIVMALGGSAAMNRIHDPVRQALEQAAAAALDGDMLRGAELEQQAKAQWERSRKLVCAMADHSPMDEIDRLFAQAEVYALAQKQEELADACAQLARLMQSMTDAHSPTWWNLL